LIKKFITDTGIEVPAISTAQMQEVDRIAMENTGPSLIQMMENAGRDLALLTMELLGKNWQHANIVVLAGTGGNGGGGICAARHLANHAGKIKLCITNLDKLNSVPVYQRKIFHSTSGNEITSRDLQKETADFVLDAIIGYSLLAAPHGKALQFIQWANDVPAPILSLDVPSGIDSTSGNTPGEYIHAHHTLTLALPKTGLVPEKTGSLFLADIGIPQAVYRQLGIPYQIPFDTRYIIPLKLSE
jgi:NAD(P)H-hydrate epimerase